MNISFGRSSSGNSGSSERSIGGAIFCSIFGIFGAVFLFFLSNEMLEILATRNWEARSCQIETARVTDVGGEEPYKLLVSYRYFVDGKSFLSSKYSRNETRSDSYNDLERIAKRLEAERTVPCFVNPDDPKKSIIKHDSLWFGLFAIIPLIFLAIGIYGAYACLFPGRLANKSSDVISSRANPQNSNAGNGFLFIFFGIFFLVGAGLAPMLLIKPIGNYLSSSSWDKKECKVISSRVQSHVGDESTTYSVDILYEYSVNGSPYRSNSYDFFDGSSSGYESKKEIVREHPPGKLVTCYVDPSDPSNAVLDPSFSWKFALGLIPLVFAGAGLAGMTWAFKKRRQESHDWETSISGIAPEKAAYQDTDWLPINPKTSIVSGQPGPVLATTSPKAKLICSIIISVFVTGLIQFLFWEVYDGWKRSNPDYFLTVFSIPFMLVMIGSWGMVGHCFLALFNPRALIRLEPLAFRLGEEVRISWAVEGKSSAVKQITIDLTAEEVAQYTRGTSTYTDKRTIETIKVIDMPYNRGLQNGEATFTIPKTSMHSFQASNNKIIWTLKFRGDIPNWPDISESFVLRVLPAKVTGVASHE